MPDVRPLPVWKNSKIVDWAWVDHEDWEWARRYRWSLSDGYALRSTYQVGDDGHEFKTTISMHREIMGLENGDPREVDHRDRNRLNNRRSNLKIATRWENEQNKPSSGPKDQRKGITFDRRLGKWKAQASLDGAYQYLGVYDTESEAEGARERWEILHGRLSERGEVTTSD